MVPPKVVFLVSHPSAGGVQEIWVNLAEGFRSRGNDVHLMALYPLHDRALRETPAELPWEYLAPRRPRVGVNLLFQLARTFRRLQPDIVFTAMPFVNVLAPIAARLAGTRTRIVTSHHSPAFTHGAMLNRLDGVVGGWNSVHAIVSVSDAVKVSLAAKPARYRARCVTIHNALPPRVEAQIDRLAPIGPRQLSGKRKVIATGRLSAQKNYETLLAAARLLPDVSLDIIGSGPDEAKLRALAQSLDVTDRVNFLGQRPREEALALLAGADLFVQPSLFEGHSLGLIEAARLKLPLVVSSAPAQLEGITDHSGQRCGMVVDTLDHAQLARTIRHLLDNAQAYAQWSDLAARLGASASYQAMLDAYSAFLPQR